MGSINVNDDFIFYFYSAGVAIYAAVSFFDDSISVSDLGDVMSSVAFSPGVLCDVSQENL